MRILLAVLCWIPTNCVKVTFNGDWAILEQDGCHLELNYDGIDIPVPQFDSEMSPCFDPEDKTSTDDALARLYKGEVVTVTGEKVGGN
jgi:hypothetical protein